MEKLIEKKEVRVEWEPAHLVAMGFVGKSKKARFHFKFKTIEKLQNYAVEWVQEQLLNLEAREKYKAELRVSRATATKSS